MLLAVVLATACSALLGPDATPVPGAAATLTRSINTPIPTPIRSPSALPSPSPSPARVALAASPSPATDASAGAAGENEIADLQQRFERALSTPSLSGIDALLLDHVALSTSQGGRALDSAETASWLRDHAGPDIKVTSVTRATQEGMVQVQTDGWPRKDPVQSGQVSFSLRRYDSNGRQDETGTGEWKVDVIEAD